MTIERKTTAGDPSLIEIDVSAESIMGGVFADMFGGVDGHFVASFGARPGSISDKFENTPDRVRRLYDHAILAEANGESSFFSPMVWEKTSGTLKKDTSTPASATHVLWVDIDRKDKDGKPRKINDALLGKLTARGCLVLDSGSNGNLHVWFVIEDDMDGETVGRVNRELKQALGADHKDSIASWLRLPLMTSFKPVHGEHGRAVRIRDYDDRAWPLDEFRALLASEGPRVLKSVVREHSPGIRVTDAVRPSRRLVTGSLRKAFSNDDRSEAAFAVTKEGIKAGLSIDEVAGILLYHRLAQRIRDKHDDDEARIIKDLERIWPKAAAEVEDAKPQRKADPPRKTSWTIDQLMGEKFPPLRFIADGLVTEGLTLVVASPKTGKSFWMLDLALSVIQGLPAFGSVHTTPGEVLYLNLEGGGGRSLQSRVRSLLKSGDLKPKFQIQFETEWETMPDGGIEALDDWLTGHPDCSLVVIDTLAAFKGAPASNNRDQFAADYAPAKALSDLAHKHRCAIAIAHHDRKAESVDFVDSISGTKGLTAAADVLIILRRSRNKPDGKMLLVAREMEGNEWNVVFEEGRWKIVDAVELVERAGDTRGRVLTALADEVMTAKELHTALPDIAEGTIKTALSRLAGEGLVHHDRPSHTYSRM